jgi:hypothetical protein
MLHLPDHLYRDVGIFIDTGLLILLVAIAYLLWRYVQAVRQVHAIGRSGWSTGMILVGTRQELVRNPL